MNTRNLALAGGATAVAVVAGVLMYLQSFDAEKISCDGIAEARASLQAAHEAGVNASVAVYAEEKSEIDERLSQCLSAKPVGPCADAQKVRDDAVANFNNISSPADTAPYEEHQAYFNARDSAYHAYKAAKQTLDDCRAANPPQGPVPYEQSDTKACFDSYDAAVEGARTTFTTNTQTMRTALNAALNALDAREKACNPPKGKEQFTDPPREDGAESDATTSGYDIASCKLLDANADPELFTLRARAAAIPGEIQVIDTSIRNIEKRMSPLKVDLSEVDTYIPPESAKTQFEGALNALRAERKVSIETALDFYQKMLERRQGEKATLEAELAAVEARIAARLAEIERENAERQSKYPTALHQAKPDKCGYYHCHGLLCGRPDPIPDGCGHGATTQDDLECTQFLDAFFKEAGV